MKLKKKRTLTLEKRQGIMGYVFISPFLLGFIFIFLAALVQSFMFSINDIELTVDRYMLKSVGFANYSKVFIVHPKFRRVLIESITRMLLDVPIIIIFSFFMATLLNQKFKGRTVARALFFLPVILATGIVARVEATDMMFNMLSAGEGVDTGIASGTFQTFEIKYLLLQMKMSPKYISYIIDAIDRIYDVVVTSGVQMLIFLAGLQSIPSSLFEAAHVEGATGWESFWKITFPMVSPLILVNAIYTVIDSFTNPNNPVMLIIHETAFKNSEYGYASAMAWIYFAVILCILGVVAWIISRRVFYYE
jgi:ABC-type sugar transport system permease subunit